MVPSYDNFTLVLTVWAVVHFGLVGAWRSPVAHLHGGQVVAGSNPVAPTEFQQIRDPALVRTRILYANQGEAACESS